VDGDFSYFRSVAAQNQLTRPRLGEIHDIGFKVGTCRAEAQGVVAPGTVAHRTTGPQYKPVYQFTLGNRKETQQRFAGIGHRDESAIRTEPIAPAPRPDWKPASPDAIGGSDRIEHQRSVRLRNRKSVAIRE
jgi:hypothetical protein